MQETGMNKSFVEKVYRNPLSPSLSLSLSFSEAAANIILYLSLPDLTVCPFGAEVNVKIACY